MAGKLPRVRQLAYVVGRAQKPAALQRVLDMESPSSALVFCRTRLEVDTLVETLNAHGYRAEALHGGMQQRQRDSVMNRFRAAKADLLIATDVAARGLDIEQLSHVFNYDLPSAAEDYVHRIGRTGRAGREGTAITLVEPREHRLLRTIEHFTKQKIEVGSVPTVADLRAKRLESTRASLRDRILAGDLDDARVVVESLAEEFDVARRRGRGGEDRACRDRGRGRRPRGGDPAGRAARRAAERSVTSIPGRRSGPAARPASALEAAGGRAQPAADGDTRAGGPLRATARTPATAALRRASQDDPHVVRAAVVDERNRGGVGACAVEGRRHDPAARVFGVENRDLVARVLEPPGRSRYPGHDEGMHGSTLNVPPRRRRPRMLSRPARYSQPADPVYQLQPPRPACGGRA